MAIDQRYVALLRGINVGGKNVIRMADLLRGAGVGGRGHLPSLMAPTP